MAMLKITMSETKRSAFRTLDTKKEMSVYLKILLNYLQMISIIRSLELKWPFYVGNYLNIYANFGGVSTQILSFDCLLQDYSIETESIYIQTILAVSLPFTIFLISIVALVLLCLKNKKTRKTQKTRFIVVVIVVSIFLQPSIIKTLFDNITCKQIDDSQYLKENFLIDCETNSQKTWVRIDIKEKTNKKFYI